MQQFGRPGGGGPATAGLVLLYAESFEELPAAWPLARDRAVIGREDADLTIPVHAVSRVHAELVKERGGWVLRDLGSRNGTLLDGRPVAEARLEAGGEIRVGDAILKFVDSDVEELVRYRIDGTMVPPNRRRASGGSALVGGYQMDRIAADLERIAITPLSVVLLGESGTGKEVVARELHRLSGRSGDFCAVNCAAIPGNLLESELFGYKRGAFSGADRDKPGLIRAAHQGTLLLDEIGDMPPEAQAKLLRVLQTKEVVPLGSTQAESVDVRVVCATHRDLVSLQKEGKFREDLYARLNEYQLRLPALRDRKEDVYMLLLALLARHGRPELRPSFPYIAGLLHYEWPYNVRELEACVKRSIALCQEATLEELLLPDQIREAMADYGKASKAAPVNDAAPDQPAKRAPTADELRDLLRRHAGNVAAVGRELGKARMQIHRWMKRYAIEVDEFRDESS